jgi:uncharacterized protein (DUF2236 family)
MRYWLRLTRRLLLLPLMLDRKLRRLYSKQSCILSLTEECLDEERVWTMRFTKLLGLWARQAMQYQQAIKEEWSQEAFEDLERNEKRLVRITKKVLREYGNQGKLV